MASKEFSCTAQAPREPHPADQELPILLTLRNDSQAALWVGCHTDVLINLDGLMTSLKTDFRWPETKNQHFHIDAGQSASIEVLLPQLLYYFRGMDGVFEGSIRLVFRFYRKLSESDYDHLDLEADILVKFEMSRLKNLPGPDGPSEFFLSDRGVLHAKYYTDGSRTASVTFLKMDAQNCRALTGSIVCNDKKMFWADWAQRRPLRDSLQGLNNVFYGDKDGIWTNYGNAKIDDPASFEVLSEAQPALFTNTRAGYLCSYGRDQYSAYYFDESVSTKHAKKVRACKRPDRLVAIGSVWAKDDSHVYKEGVRVKGADAGSFELINNCFAKDINGIWFIGRNFLGPDYLAQQITVLSEDRRTPSWTLPDPLVTSHRLKVGDIIYDGDKPEDDLLAEIWGV